MMIDIAFLGRQLPRQTAYVKRKPRYLHLWPMPNAELEMQNARIAAASVFSFGIWQSALRLFFYCHYHDSYSHSHCVLQPLLTVLSGTTLFWWRRRRVLSRGIWGSCRRSKTWTDVVMRHLTMVSEPVCKANDSTMGHWHLTRPLSRRVT